MSRIKRIINSLLKARRQLPPQIKRVELGRRVGGRPVVRYQLTVDVGAVDGKRKQYRKRFATEKEARAALEEIRGEVACGTYVHPARTTLAQGCEDWLASKHGLKPSTLLGHRVKLEAVTAVLGDVEVQKLTKRDIDDLDAALRVGGGRTARGAAMKARSARSVNYLLGLLSGVLRDPVR